MSNIRQVCKALVARVLEGDGAALHVHRRAAFDNAGLSNPTGTLIGKVVHHANAVIDEDIVSVLASGLSEDPIFELVVCAAIGQAARQYDIALAALDAASGKR
jgi:ribosomal protein L12E/L44/L45/RPP1/RPP2